MTRPGVTVTEAPLQRAVNAAAPTESYGAFLGTALKGPTFPVRVDSWSDFVATFGGFSYNVTLPLALYQYFINGGKPAYVMRGMGTGATAASAVFDDGGAPPNRIQVNGVNSGTWGRSISFEILLDTSGSTFTFAVYENLRGVDVVVERFVDLSMDTSAPRYFANIINSPTIGSRYVTVTDLTDVARADDDLLVGTSGKESLTGGSNGTGSPDWAAGFDLFDDINAMLVVNVPGDQTGAVSIASKVEARGDSVLIIDSNENQTPADIIGDSDIPGVDSAGSSYAAVYYPWVYVADPAPDAPRGGVVKVPPGASVAGMILRTDASRGIFKAPAGVGATLSGVVATEQRLKIADLDALSAAHINAIRPVPGSGISVMGARTRATTAAKYLSVRRTLNYVKQKAALTSGFALFEPNTPGLWDQLRVANGAWLSELWQVGGLAGTDPRQAFYVKCDDEINTNSSMAAGEVHLEIGVAPVYPAEYVIIRVGQFESDASTVVTEEV